MKKKESAEKTKALTTFEIAAELRALVESIIACDGNCDEETMQEFDKWNLALENKAENICHVKARLETEMEYYKQVEEKARSYRKAREGAIERIRRYLAQAMKVAQVEKIKKDDGLFSVSLVAGKAKLIIDDQGKLPLDMIEVIEVIKPISDKIKTALEAGQVIPGAHLEISEPYVMIR
jgi:hypothetical protein